MKYELSTHHLVVAEFAEKCPGVTSAGLHPEELLQMQESLYNRVITCFFSVTLWTVYTSLYILLLRVATFNSELILLHDVRAGPSLHDFGAPHHCQ